MHHDIEFFKSKAIQERKELRRRDQLIQSLRKKLGDLSREVKAKDKLLKEVEVKLLRK